MAHPVRAVCPAPRTRSVRTFEGQARAVPARRAAPFASAALAVTTVAEPDRAAGPGPDISRGDHYGRSRVKCATDSGRGWRALPRTLPSAKDLSGSRQPVAVKETEKQLDVARLLTFADCVQPTQQALAVVEAQGQLAEQSRRPLPRSERVCVRVDVQVAETSTELVLKDESRTGPTLGVACSAHLCAATTAPDRIAGPVRRYGLSRGPTLVPRATTRCEAAHT